MSSAWRDIGMRCRLVAAFCLVTKTHSMSGTMTSLSTPRTYSRRLPFCLLCLSTPPSHPPRRKTLHDHSRVEHNIVSGWRCKNCTYGDRGRGSAYLRYDTIQLEFNVQGLKSWMWSAQSSTRSQKQKYIYIKAKTNKRQLLWIIMGNWPFA